MYYISVIDSIGDHHVLEYKKYEYRTLMELLVDKLFDDIGDCRGRGLCGTCHIRIYSPSSSLLFINDLEKNTLNYQLEYYLNSRLACQITVDEHIHKMNIEIIGRD
ncbi:2Fe-2S iron-sulfur cluster-binding protein [Aquimarina longa]|uniref:2Fe-2S iron-sulfur cluster-binding protein n=1 Tax=Aquimarina longa TaxID=1080221 RepID=UPI000785F91C|nr:2Fe-2S iron-sulfur cluster-binding protein [Aquimarina longa]